MSVGYGLLCRDCNKEVDAVSSSLGGNSPGDYQGTLDFLVEHAGHRLVVLCENEIYDHINDKITFDA